MKVKLTFNQQLKTTVEIRKVKYFFIYFIINKQSKTIRYITYKCIFCMIIMRVAQREERKKGVKKLYRSVLLKKILNKKSIFFFGLHGIYQRFNELFYIKNI